MGRKRKWTEEKIMENTSSCTTLGECDPSALSAAKTLGIYDEATKHIKIRSRTKKGEGLDTDPKSVMEIASGYDKLGDFTETFAYVAARRLGILDKATAHMERKRAKNGEAFSWVNKDLYTDTKGDFLHRCVYTFENLTLEQAYAGVTENLTRRLHTHRSSKPDLLNHPDTVITQVTDYIYLVHALQLELMLSEKFNKDSKFECLSYPPVISLGGNKHPVFSDISHVEPYLNYLRETGQI